MKQEIQQYLQITYSNKVNNDSKLLSQAEIKLNQLTKNNGFCLKLLEVIDDYKNPFQTRLAAIIVLIHNVQNRWKNVAKGYISLDSQQKKQIKSSIIRAITRCPEKKLIRNYISVLKLIVSFEYETWAAEREIRKKLIENSDLSATFYCILGVSESFKYMITDKQKKIFFNFVRGILPEVLTILQNNKGDNQLKYLGLKFAYKVARYSSLPISIKNLLNQWMQLLLSTINIYEDTLQKNIANHATKYSQEFYYFHSKKWATKVILLFLQKHTQQKNRLFKVSLDNVQFAKKWYEVWAPEFIESITLLMPVHTIEKIRILQYKIIQAFILQKPALVLKYAEYYQQNALLQSICLQLSDQTLGRKDPVEFIKNQIDQSSDFKNLRQHALNLWVSFMQLGSNINQSTLKYSPGPLFQSSYKLIISNLSNQNLVYREVSMRLFCKVKDIINSVPESKILIPQILIQYVIPNLSSEAWLIRARAFEIIEKYGQCQLDEQSLQQIIECFKKSLLTPQIDLIKIKAVTALKSLLTHSLCKESIKPHLQQILQILLKLIKLYDLEELVNSLEIIIKSYAHQINPFTCQLFDYLSNYFIHSIYQNNATNDTVEGLLSSMTQIIQVNLDYSTRAALEPKILQLCSLMFQRKWSIYFNQLVYMLGCHIFKMKNVSNECWFFFNLIIYYIVGVPPEILQNFHNLSFSENNRRILQNGDFASSNLYVLQEAFFTLRNFIVLGAQTFGDRKQQYVNFIQIVIYLIGQIYVKYQRSSNDSSERILSAATNLLIYLVENSSPESILQSGLSVGIMAFIKFNIDRSKSLHLKVTNIQLIAVCLWRITDFIIRAQDFERMISEISKYYVKLQNLEESYERKRLILGISMLLTKCQFLDKIGMISRAPELFKILLRLLIRNCKWRKTHALQANNLKNPQYKVIELDTIMQYYQKSPFFSQEETQIFIEQDQEQWQEQYSVIFQDKLCIYDQIYEFANFMAHLKNNIPILFEELIKAVGGAQTMTEIEKQINDTLNINKIIQRNTMQE